MHTPGTRTVLCAIDLDWKRDNDASAGGRLVIGTIASATLRAADAEARHRQAVLALIHALPLDPGAAMTPEGVEETLVERQRLTRLIIDGLTRALESLDSPPSSELAVMVEDQPADEAITRAAQRLAADLVVLGDGGAGARRRPLLGSVAASVVQRAPCSVLVVRTRSA